MRPEYSATSMTEETKKANEEGCSRGLALKSLQ